MPVGFRSELLRLEAEGVEKNAYKSFQRTKDINHLDSNTEDAGVSGCLANIREEAAREKEYKERTDHAATVNERARKETALCFEINKIKEEVVSKEQRRQQLRQTDPELKELVRKLQASYVCRDRKQQILNNEYKRLQEKQEELQSTRQLQASLQSEREESARQSRMQAAARGQYCAELQQQIVNSNRRRQCLFEESLLEKKMIDDVVRTIYDEDMRELELKREKAEGARRDQRSHLAAQAAWREKQKLLVSAEQRRIERQAAGAVDRDAAAAAERKQKLEMKEAINERTVAMLLDEEAKREERNSVIMSLQEQECLERSLNDAQAEREKIARSKLENRLSLTAQMEIRKEQAARDKELARRFRLDIEQQNREEDEKEQEKARTKRERQKQYTSDLRQQIQANEAKRRQERRGEAARDQAVRDCNEDRQQRIAAERDRLIEDHAPRLLGCMQPGAIGKRDMPALRRGAARLPDSAGLDVEAVAGETDNSETRNGRRHSKCNSQCQVLREY